MSLFIQLRDAGRGGGQGGQLSSSVFGSSVNSIPTTGGADYTYPINTFWTMGSSGYSGIMIGSGSCGIEKVPITQIAKMAKNNRCLPWIMDGQIRGKNHQTSKVWAFLAMYVGCPDKIHLC